MFARKRSVQQIHEETTLTSLIEKHQRQWNVSKRRGRDYHVWSPVYSVVITMDHKTAFALDPLLVIYNNDDQKLYPKSLFYCDMCGFCSSSQKKEESQS